MPNPSAIVLNGQIGLQSSRDALAAAGKYFVVTNPTPGTTITWALKTSYSATANGLFSISNNNPVGGANIQLDRLKIIQVHATPTGTLVMRSEIFQETGIVALGTAAAALTPVNINSSFPNTTGAVVTFFASGAGTVPAAVGSRRLTSIASLATGVAVQYDSFTFEFGADGPIGGKVGLTAARAADPADLVTWHTPTTIAPQTSAWMNLWWITAAAQTPDLELTLGYSEL